MKKDSRQVECERIVSLFTRDSHGQNRCRSSQNSREPASCRPAGNAATQGRVRLDLPSSDEVRADKQSSIKRQHLKALQESGLARFVPYDARYIPQALGAISRSVYVGKKACRSQVTGN